MSNWYGCSSGGSGAGYWAKIQITEAGKYSFITGQGGITFGGAKGTSASGTPGTTSSIIHHVDETTSTIVIQTTGGTAAAWQVLGTGGTLTKGSDLHELTVYTSTNGHDGNGGFNKHGKCTTAPGPISGHTWGRSGSASGDSGGGSVKDPSCHGYIKVRYIPPTQEEP